MTENLLLDFTHTYQETGDVQAAGLTRIDLSDISGTDMYCTEQAANEIRNRLGKSGPKGIHFLDSGNYHYVTLFFAEKIKQSFSLALIDHHTDMQKPMIENMLSCGSWAGELIRKNRFLKQLILIGPEQRSMEHIEEELKRKLVCICMEELDSSQAERELSRIDMSLPVYISVDKDVLSPYYARTNWNQGDMSVDILKKLLLEIFIHQKVIGVDICGECSVQEPLPCFEEDTRINRKTNEDIYRYLSSLLKKERRRIEKTEKNTPENFQK